MRTLPASKHTASIAHSPRGGGASFCSCVPVRSPSSGKSTRRMRRSQLAGQHDHLTKAANTNHIRQTAGTGAERVSGSPGAGRDMRDDAHVALAVTGLLFLFPKAVVHT